MRGVKQHREQDCGVAVLSTIFRYYKLKVPYAKITEVAKLDARGLSLASLQETARYYHFEASALNGTIDELRTGIKEQEIILPLIAHIVKEGKLEHYVVIEKLTDDFVYLFDPGTSKEKWSYDDFTEKWTGYILNIRPDSSFRAQNLTKGKYKKYFTMLFEQKLSVVMVVLASVIISAISLFSATIYQKVIDIQIIKTDRGNPDITLFDKINTQIDGLITGLDDLFILFISVVLMQAILGFLRNLVLIHFSKRVDKKMMLSYFEHVLALPLSFFNNKETGDIINRFQDITDIRFLISSAGISIIMNIITTVIGGIVLSSLNQQLFYLVLVIVGVYLLIVLLYRKSISRHNRLVKENQSELISLLKESTDGIETVKSLSVESYFIAKFTSKVSTFLKNNVKLGVVTNLVETKIGMVESIGVLFVLWRGSSMVLAGQMTVGELISFETLVYFLLNPVKDMINIFPQIQKSVITMNRINDVVDASRECDLLPRTVDKGLNFQKISFSNVSFAHGFRHDIFNDISFELTGQSNVTLIGESGGGKTSIVKLLTAFYQANSGRISIGGSDINTINLDYLRKNVIYLSQNTFLFKGSIRENLLFSEIGSDLLESVFYGFELYDISKSDISGIEYLVDENGSNLSGGQRQRLALARSILKRPQVLILDESLNQVNQEMLRRILSYICDNFSDILLIKISHHDNMIEADDIVLRLEKGKIYENRQEDTLVYST